MHYLFFFFFFNDTATTEISTLSLHDALPISVATARWRTSSCSRSRCSAADHQPGRRGRRPAAAGAPATQLLPADRKSTRLNSSHANISYAVFCLKKKKKNIQQYIVTQMQSVT